MKKVLVVFGGHSAEHDVSIITAHYPIMNALKAAGTYDVWPLYIAKDGSWYCDKKLFNIEFFRHRDYENQLKNLKKPQLLFGDGLVLNWPGLRKRKLKIDVVFPAMHGTYGEDGSLMGLLRLAHVPFVGCDMAASSVAMDKVLAKQVTMAGGIPSVKFEWFYSHQWKKDSAGIKARINRLKYPLFVKPVHLGSSIAITKVNKPVELLNALEVAMHYDDKIIVEESVENLVEVTLPIMGNQDKLQCALVERPLAGFFGYEEKYMQQGKKGSGGVNSSYSELPAKLSKELYRQVEEMGKATYQILGCSGIARVDFLIDAKTNKLFMNEVNTLPGSLYIHNWNKAGVSAVELANRLIDLAEERYVNQQKLSALFSSEILQNAQGPKIGGKEL